MKTNSIFPLLISSILVLYPLNSQATHQAKSVQAAHQNINSNTGVPNDQEHQGVIDLLQVTPSAQQRSYRLEDIRYYHDQLGWIMVIHDDEDCEE